MPDLTHESFTELRALAQRANNWGRWARWTDQDGASHMRGLFMVGNLAAVIPIGEMWVETDPDDVNPIAECYTPELADFIAAANPAAVLALLDAAAERDALREQVEAMQSTDGLSIMFGWLVHEVGEHTCGGYGPESNYMHEPGCGFEPILDLSKMEGWPGAERDALAAKVDAVRALHFGEYVEDEDRNRCFECGDDWPCPTLRALDGER